MNKQQLASKIWDSANKMRSKIEANEYKDYILGFMFYKFLSDKEQAFLEAKDFSQADIEALTEEDPETVEFIKDGQVINDNALTVYYVDQNNKWLTYDEMVSQHGKDALSVAHQIGFKGVIPVGVTAKLNVPLVVNEKGTVRTI